MADFEEIAAAQKIIRSAILSGVQPQVDAGLAATRSLVAAVTTFSPANAEEVVCDTKQGKAASDDARAGDESGFVLRLAALAAKDPWSYVPYLLRILHTDWMCGGQGFFNTAPPFVEIESELFQVLSSERIDIDGFGAVLIGRYGPEAESALPRLLELLKKQRSNCSLAPGLTWAVYQIGGLRDPVKELLLEVARGKDSCPHARPLARKILETNDVDWEREVVE